MPYVDYYCIMASSGRVSFQDAASNPDPFGLGRGPDSLEPSERGMFHHLKTHPFIYQPTHGNLMDIVNQVHDIMKQHVCPCCSGNTCELKEIKAGINNHEYEYAMEKDDLEVSVSLLETGGYEKFRRQFYDKETGMPNSLHRKLMKHAFHLRARYAQSFNSLMDSQEWKPIHNFERQRNHYMSLAKNLKSDDTSVVCQCCSGREPCTYNNHVDIDNYMDWANHFTMRNKLNSAVVAARYVDHMLRMAETHPREARKMFIRYSTPTELELALYDLELARAKQETQAVPPEVVLQARNIHTPRGIMDIAFATSDLTALSRRQLSSMLESVCRGLAKYDPNAKCVVSIRGNERDAVGVHDPSYLSGMDRVYSLKDVTDVASDSDESDNDTEFADTEGPTDAVQVEEISEETNADDNAESDTGANKRVADESKAEESEAEETEADESDKPDDTAGGVPTMIEESEDSQDDTRDEQVNEAGDDIMTASGNANDIASGDADAATFFGTPPPVSTNVSEQNLRDNKNSM